MESVFIIAEAGVNHNGSLKAALQLIDAAVEARADAVKFQTFKTEKLVAHSAPKAAYQIEATGNAESQFDMLKKLELSEQDHLELMQHCERRGIQFLSTPFDLESLALLANKLNVPMLKLPSGEITNAILLLEAAKTGKKIILSTGMSTLDEIQSALGVLAFGYLKSNKKTSAQSFKDVYASAEGQALLKANVSLLHCVTEYPAPPSEINLRAMDTLRDAFNLPVGLSDHTTGIAVPIAAVARGAVIIEKHFTLDKKQAGPDHKASLEPAELAQMVKSIRVVSQALGSSEKRPTPSEIKNIAIARKSLVAERAIKQGEQFTAENLSVKRPGTGISPMQYWDWLGKVAAKDFRAGDLISE